MGGSYAEALIKGGYTVNAITKEQSSVDFALEKGIIKYGTTKLEESIISAADLVIFALYPHVFTDWIALCDMLAGRFGTDWLGEL